MNRTVRGWALYAAAWILPAVFYALAVVAQQEATFAQALVSGIVVTSVAALEGVVVWAITGRFPLVTRAVSFYAVHLVFAILYGVVLVAAQTGWLWLVAGREIASTVVQQSGSWQLTSAAWMYAMIAGVSYLIRTQRRLREQQVAHARAEAAAAKLQLGALRAQLNPHFFFNSLHSLSTLVRHDPDAAETAVEQLGELLRYALDHGANESVPLRDEIAFVNNYLQLEKLRFGSRLDVTLAIDDDVLDTLVPPFLLQPLAENAIKHGIAPLPRGGAIRLNASMIGGFVHIEIVDNGKGADVQGMSSSQGLGLRAIREQLEGRFGDRAALRIDTQPGQGFRISISLPAHSAQPAEVLA